MTSLKKPRSLQDVIRNRQQSVFVGREEQLNLFQQSLSLPLYDDRRYFLFNIWGQGGVGKTSLINRYQKIAEEIGAITGRIDEDERDVSSVMGRFAQQFEQQGHSLRRFNERYKVYRQKREELEVDPEVPQGFAGLAGRTVAKGTLKLVEQVPVVGTVLDLVDQDALATQVGEWTTYIARKIGNKDEIKLVLQPEEVLTPLFLEDLNEVANRHLVCLFFDTYEETGNFLDDWLINVLAGDHGEVSPNLAIIIAGRNELDRNQWAQYEGLIAHLLLEPFTEDEAKDYLNRKGITNQKVIDIVLELSGRLPLLVATLAAGKPDDPETLSDASDTAVDRFLKWVDDPKKRQIALNAALLRRIDRDTLSGLVGQEDANELFYWLKEMPFVQKRTEGWTYHSVVRSQMLRYKRRESIQGWAELHGQLVEFYGERRDNLGLDPDKTKSDPTWQDHTLEMAYHSLSQSPRQRLNEALSSLLEALKAKRSFAQRFAEMIQQVGQEVEVAEIEQWGEQLANNLKVDHEDRDKADIEICSDLIKIHPNDWLLRKRGTAYKNLKCYEEAVADFTHAIELNPESEEVFTSRGDAYQEMERYEEAVADFTRAIELNPESELALISRGVAYFLLEYYEESITDFTRAIELYPKIVYVRGIAYRLVKRYEEAVADLTRAIELNPELEGAFANRGIAYRLMKRYEEAVADFTRTIELNPEAEEAFANRGIAYRLMEHYEEAVADLTRAIELNPELEGAFSSRGIAYQEMQRYEEAVADFTRTIELNPEAEEAFANRGIAYQLMKRYEEAVADLTRAIELNPESGKAFGSRGIAYQLMKRYEEAVADFTRTIELNPEFGEAFSSRGITYRLMERYEEAIADFTRAIELNPEAEEAFSSRGIAYRLMERYEEAIADFTRAIELNPESAKAFSSRGDTYRLMERYEEAVADFTRAIELNPESDCLDGWGLVLSYQGDYAEALEIYKQDLQKNLDSFATLYNIAVVSVRWRGAFSAQFEIYQACQALSSILNTEAHGAALYGLGGIEALLGNVEQSLNYLEQAIPLERNAAIWARQDVAWLDLRGDSRFQRLITSRKSIDG
jgi:tetratricopeptide (TPR) repeat protein